MGILGNGGSHTINGNGNKKSLPKRLGKCKHCCAGKIHFFLLFVDSNESNEKP